MLHLRLEIKSISRGRLNFQGSVFAGPNLVLDVLLEFEKWMWYLNDKVEVELLKTVGLMLF